MRVAGRPLLQLEEVPQVREGEVPLDVLLSVDHTRTQRLFVSLPLKYLLLNGSNLNGSRKLSKRGRSYLLQFAIWKKESNIFKLTLTANSL